MISPNEPESPLPQKFQSMSDTAPSSSPRGFLHGREISVAFNNRPLVDASMVTLERAEIGLLYNSAHYVLSHKDATHEERALEISGQHAVVIAPGVPHAWAAKEPGEIVWIQADRSLVERVTHCPLPLVAVIGPSDAPEEKNMVRQFSEILRDLTTEADGCEFLIESIASSLACWFLHSVDLMYPVQPEPKPGLTVVEFEAVLQHMQANLKYEIHVVDLAKKVGRSVPHFAELFRNTTGQPPYEYLTQLRMMKAFELLLTTNRSVREVAREVGFTDAEHFTEKFQRYMNLSPRQVARNARLRSGKRPAFSAKRPEQN
jgi:AraC-like DNA-binding protein